MGVSPQRLSSQDCPQRDGETCLLTNPRQPCDRCLDAWAELVEVLKAENPQEAFARAPSNQSPTRRLKRRWWKRWL